MREALSADAPAFVGRDGELWRLGAPSDVSWITSGTGAGRTIASAIPRGFDAFATIELPRDHDDQRPHDHALLRILRSNTDANVPWWLGYLDTGADDIVFPDAHRVKLYSNWSYVLVLAGPDQAATWRYWSPGSFWMGQLPNLIFPEDHTWLVSTLWDDDWTCVGGSDELISQIVGEPGLQPRARCISSDSDMTPPGHRML